MFPNNKITASNETILNQAPRAAELFLSSAINSIDASLGKGYAAKNPELIAAFMNIAVADMSSIFLTRSLEGIGSSIDGMTCALDRIGDSIAGMKGD